MATTSRQNTLFGVNDWKTIYKTFSSASFLNYDYETLRKSFIDYIKQMYPETFNDYVESSEFVALLDVMAFMGQSMAFRDDLNTRENFIDTAERRDSVIKLANLVSYTPKRNLAAEGYLKVVSIKSTQNITDINGYSLSNNVVVWNDTSNPDWQEQFNTIINASLVSAQRIGAPGNSSQILGVNTLEYDISIPQTNLPVYPFSSFIDNTEMRFELVSATGVGQPFIYERPPGPTNKFNILYRNDTLGYGSPNTGFFFYFKQGQLQTYNFDLTQKLSNQIVPISIPGVNNSDTWLYQTVNGTMIPWQLIDNIYADAYNQTLTSTRQLFSVASEVKDQVSYLFGDGVISDIPIGNFSAYVRSSYGQTFSIDPVEMQSISVSIPYISRVGRAETLTIGLALELPVNNAQSGETLTNIKQRAPTRFYTQNRMVNGEDYNNFPYSLYSSIIKSKALNRTSVGVSRSLDLLDPSGKYSSTNTFALDGALYFDDALGVTSFDAIDRTNIISFLSSSLAVILTSNRVLQYYLQSYPRYEAYANDNQDPVYWRMQSLDAYTNTGYFYLLSGTDTVAVPVGTYSTQSVKYITKNAMLQFLAPDGSYFDQNNRVVPGIPGPSDTTSIWVTVLNVIGDGYNYGQGALSNGKGPITLSSYVPNGAVLSMIIPAFSNVLPAAVVQECVTRIGLAQHFSLKFDNSLSLAQDRWSIVYPGLSNPTTDVWPTGTMINFHSDSTTDRTYSVTYKTLSYFFGSVADTRFLFETDKLVYDPLSGKTLHDGVTVLSTNTQPSSHYPLIKNVPLGVIDQPIDSDGYVNDFIVEISSIPDDNMSLILDPDFFLTVTGYPYGQTNTRNFVFFEQVTDSINLTKKQLVPTSSVVYQYITKSEIEVVKYEYPVGQIFYAYADSPSPTFYKTVQDNTTQTISYTLVAQTQFSVKPGRQGLSFQYKHNSNNTTRINPATTNIIDLYLVTQSYYTSYNNWLQDSTNTLTEPNKPTINELNVMFDKLQSYKMISDSIILNSVIFKPLFGPKADPALRATVKVIKTPSTNSSDSEIRSATLDAMNSYFDINNWDFGDVFYFSELSAYLHAQIGQMVSSVVLVPDDPSKSFGDLYEINAAPYEIFVNAITANDIVVISSLTPAELQIR